jgi:UDP-glucuronate decarboxylase
MLWVEMKNLVTGGAGFLGFHLSKKLLDLGQEVIVVDNLFTGQQRNIDELSNYSNFVFEKMDVVNPYKFEIDRIFNLASPASPVHYQSDPIKTTRTNFLGALNALELATELNIPVLQASTSEVYGDPLVHPQVEEYWGNVNPIGIRSCYDEGKRGAETLCFDFYREHKTKIKIMRIFNTYGPNMQVNDGRVVSNFIIQALKNEPITLYGNGQHTRSFCYVDDLIKGMILFIDSKDGLTGPVNFGNPKESTIEDLAKKVVELTGSRSEIINVELPDDDPARRKPSIEKAKELLGWEPEIDLNTGLISTIKYFEKILSS